MHESMHSYSSKNSFSSDYSSSFFSSFSYSNLAVKKYWDKIHSCINYLTRHAAFFKLLISFLMFICLIHKFCKAAQHFMNLLQCIVTYFTVFLIWLHEQIDDKKLRIWILFKKTTSLLQFIQIYMIIEFFIFCSCI